MGFHHVAQTTLKLLGSSNLPAFASQTAGIIGMSHWAWTIILTHSTRHTRPLQPLSAGRPWQPRV
ncbi:Zinc finger protein 195 [Plecturocebus cupreus]